MRRLDTIETLNESEKQLMCELKHVITRFIPDAVVILYGSAARGEHVPESDYDVLVLSDRKLPSAEEELMDSAIYDLQLHHEVVLSVMVYSQAEWESPIVRQSPYYDNVTADGVMV